MDLQFLDEIDEIFHFYENQDKLAGEDFNLFTLLNRETDEVQTHSSIIIELLNPRGKHCLGDGPLNEFVKLIADLELDSNSVNCFKELPIGKIDANEKEGGRIDIYLKDSYGKSILIENKIYASEQKDQLTRYYNFDPKGTIVYLTLEGEQSKDANIDFEYKILSYREDIIEWINKCAQMAYNKPKVRESLNQYIHLIKKLTNQTENREMSDKIKDIIKNNFIASTEIFRNYDLVYNELYKTLLEELKEDLDNSDITCKSKIIEYKGENSIKLTLVPYTFSINIRIKNKSIIAINIFKVNNISKNQEKSLIAVGFNCRVSKVANTTKTSTEVLENVESYVNIPHAWKTLTDFNVSNLSSKEERKELKATFIGLIEDTIARVK